MAEQPSHEEKLAMLDSVTLEGRLVRLEPISVDHIPGLVQAANQSPDMPAILVQSSVLSAKHQPAALSQ